MDNVYLERYAYPRSFIDEPPRENLNLIITIPCYHELNLIDSLDSLSACQPPAKPVEIIVVINESIDASAEVSQRNETSFMAAQTWALKYNTPQFNMYPIYVNDLPKKHFGVGLARKIAMDEAVRRFERIGNSNGIIACFDADAQCEPNYLMALEKHFELNPHSPGCAIHFEHPLEGENSRPIIYYELLLRYYIEALRYAGFPHAYQTVGSSMAVRSAAYQKQGGMNKRKAGEDFYFLHRIIRLGGFTDLVGTRVIPSPRGSNRVPFGTGRAILDWKRGHKDLTLFYNPLIFEDLRAFICATKVIWKEDLNSTMSASMINFLQKINFNHEVERIRKSSRSEIQFRKHFFQWFDGFKVLKYVHFARDNFYDQVDLNAALKWLFLRKGFSPVTSPKAALIQLRNFSKKNGLFG